MAAPDWLSDYFISVATSNTFIGIRHTLCAQVLYAFSFQIARDRQIMVPLMERNTIDCSNAECSLLHLMLYQSLPYSRVDSTRFPSIPQMRKYTGSSFLDFELLRVRTALLRP